LKLLRHPLPACISPLISGWTEFGTVQLLIVSGEQGPWNDRITGKKAR